MEDTTVIIVNGEKRVCESVDDVVDAIREVMGDQVADIIQRELDWGYR